MASRLTAGHARRLIHLVLVVLLALGAGALWYFIVGSQGSEAAPRGEKVAVFLGDSYTQGVGAGSPEARWASVVAATEGWREVNLGRGGTGYLATAGAEGCGQPYCPNYLQTLPDVLSAAPDVVVVAGGQNDLAAFGSEPAVVVAQIDATFRALRTALPWVTIIAVGPSSPGEAGESTRALDAEVRRGAEAADAVYVSLLDPPAITKDMVLPDGAHVGDAGHAAIAGRVLDALD